MKKIVLVATICCFISFAYGQNSPIIPVGIGEKLSEIELSSFQGETYNTNDLVGEKNILLRFGRGEKYTIGIPKRFSDSYYLVSYLLLSIC